MKVNLSLIGQVATLIAAIWSASWFAGTLDKRISILELTVSQTENDLTAYRSQQKMLDDKQNNTEQRFADSVNRRLENIELSMCQIKK